MSFKTQLALFVLMYGFDLDGFAVINMNIFVPNETETQDCPLSRCTSSCPRVNHDTISHINSLISHCNNKALYSLI